MLDDNQHVIEGTMSNLFCLLDDQLYTPRLDRAGVEGVMRQQIIENAKARSLVVNEVDISLQNFLNMDAVFVCNSLIGIWPVITVTTDEQIHSYPVPKCVSELQVSIRASALPGVSL